jgi:thiol-disulfide isomerase/thioredoxin
VRAPIPLLALALLAGACGHPDFPPSSQHPLLGQPLPAIHHRQTLAGQAFDGAQLAGKPVLIKFFAEYCKPCQVTLPGAERVHEDHPEVRVVGIDEDESSETAGALVQRYGLTFPVIHDDGNVLSGRFHVSAMPMTFMVDASGVVRWVGGEGQTEADLRRAIEAAQ